MFGRKYSNDYCFQNHAYGILQAKEAEGKKFIHIRNPWGKGEWEGRWSDKSPLWTDSLKVLITPEFLNFLQKELNWMDANDGCFWMCIEDFVKYFNTFYKCNIIDDKIKRIHLEGEWKGKSAGGCRYLLSLYQMN